MLGSSRGERSIDLEHIFNDFGLNITVLTNQLQTNFLDLTLDLTNDTYKPYRKPNDTPLYINRLSPYEKNTWNGSHVFHM